MTNQTTATSAASTVRVVVLAAHSTADSSDEPEYCAFSINAELIDKINRLVDLCQEQGLSQVNFSANPDEWGPAGVEENARLQGGELVVCASGGFWFSDAPKYGPGYFESEIINVEAVQQMLAEHDACVVFQNDEVRELYEEDHKTSKTPASPEDKPSTII